MIVHVSVAATAALWAALLFGGAALILDVLSGPPSDAALAVLGALSAATGVTVSARCSAALTRPLRRRTGRR